MRLHVLFLTIAAVLLAGCTSTFEQQVAGASTGPDHDSDGVSDALDADDDNDGVPDASDDTLDEPRNGTSERK